MATSNSESLFLTPKKQIVKQLVCPGAPKKAKRSLPPLPPLSLLQPQFTPSRSIVKRSLSRNNVKKLAKNVLKSAPDTFPPKNHDDDSLIFSSSPPAEGHHGWERNLFNPNSCSYKFIVNEYNLEHKLRN
ncbi:hypothetical protein AYI69_g3236 [Smittium culicis]|uniref:Uncharacterized protein n=1 Tax=Smittium culicis TaxID=133412 RepID=A0A1R1YK87_9FUNG|nr:hypothetical protein AYI69_g3236 [Smittium culicis]